MNVHSPRRRAIVTIAVAVLASCSGDDGSVHLPARPIGVPENATYAWNGESGAWVICKVSGPSTITCDQYYEISGELVLRVHLRLCMNLEPDNELSKPPVVPIDIGDTDSIFNEVRFFIERQSEYIGSQDRDSARVQSILQTNALAFRAYGVSEDCEPLGDRLIEVIR